jgi:hypothetical protein
MFRNSLLSEQDKIIYKNADKNCILLNIEIIDDLERPAIYINNL